MNLSLDQLKNKELPGVQSVLTLSFEYLLASIGKEYSRLNTYKTIDEFNKKNRLNFSKTILYPFFVSLSNGNSQSLYGLFGEFYALSFGPVSLNIFNLLNEAEIHEIGNGSPFTFFKITPIGVEVNIQTIGATGDQAPDIVFEALKERIKQTNIILADGEKIYKEINIDSDTEQEDGTYLKKPLFQAIESGITAIKKQSDGFFTADPDIMKLHASYFDAFKKRLTSNEASAIDYGELEEGKRRPFYLNIE